MIKEKGGLKGSKLSSVWVPRDLLRLLGLCPTDWLLFGWRAVKIGQRNDEQSSVDDQHTE